MKLLQAMLVLARNWLVPSASFIRAVWRFPHVNFAAGVSVGPRCSFGREVRIYQNTLIAEASIGFASYVGGHCVLKNCTIGKYCSIGGHVQIGLGVHPTNLISSYPGFYSAKASGALKLGASEQIQESKHIVIGNDVWIGNNVIVLDGVTIGDGAIIGAGAVVTRDVEPYAVMVGVPAALVRHRFDEEMIGFLLEFRWWDRSPEFLRQNAELFRDPKRFVQAMSALK